MRSARPSPTSRRGRGPAVAGDGDLRDIGDVVEADLLDLTRWPTGMRVIIRRDGPHAGAQLSPLEEAEGWRYNPSPPTPGWVSWRCEAPHRAHACVEDRNRHAKDSGLGAFPSREFANQA